MPAGDDERTRRAALANMRQKLRAPVEALCGYADLLSDEIGGGGFEPMVDDIGRIRKATNELAGLVERLLTGDVSALAADDGDVASAEKILRHDLRTPINAIMGYGEMLLEDADDLAEAEADKIRPDLQRMLSEAGRLLSQLGTIVKFGGDAPAVGEDDKAAGEMFAKLFDSLRPLDDAETKPSETGRILVVDDIEANRDLLARRLIGDGHRVVTVDGGVAALDILQKEDFDLVLLDLMMPDLNGFEVLARMKADDDLRAIPVVMVSALDEADSVVRCIGAGADDFLSKPVNSTLLRARIRSGLEKKNWADDERRQKRFIRQAFSRFLAPAVVDQLISDPSKLSLGGKRMELTFIFTDLAGFTHLIEKSEPSVVLPVLNAYLDGLCRIVLDHGGTIDKIVGDALHAFFGAPLETPDHAQRAMKCVLDLDHHVRTFARSDEARALAFGDTRIGVHTGMAVVGNFGGESFFDYTAHGDAVNTAARMESVNKHLGTQICVSAVTAKRCPDISFRPVGTLVLVGKSQGIEAFEPLPSGHLGLPGLKGYLEAFAKLHANEPGDLDAFRQLARQDSKDALVAFHVERLSAGETGSTIVLKAK